MVYQTGFKELSETEERRFLELLGMTKGRLDSGMKAPKQWAYGWPKFQAPVDIWIKVYHSYSKSLGIQEKAALHRTINRLFFSLKEGRFISRKDRSKNLKTFRERYIIPESMKSGHEAQIWLKLAGAYTQALMESKSDDFRRQRIVQFEKKMPIEWLNIEKAGYNDPIQKRAFTKFVDALNDNWFLFIDSYRTEVHAASINNSPHAASLQSFLRGRYPDGRPLKRTSPLTYWPKPLIHYAGQETARQLFEAKKVETELLKPFCSSADGSEVSTIYSFPRWLRLGIDGIDPKPRPPLWKPKALK